MFDMSLGPARVSNIERIVREGSEKSVGEVDEEKADCKERRRPSKDPSENDIENETSGNAHAGYLQHCDGISLFRHPCQSRGAAFEVR
jgi:hypothetical protein